MNESTPPGTTSPQRTEDEILRAERQRIASIEAAAKGFEDYESVQQIKARALEGLATREDVDAAALQVIRDRRPKFEGGSFVPGLLGGAPARGSAKPEDVLAAALMCRSGYESAAEKEFGPHVLEASRPLHNASMIDMCKAALKLEGRDIPSDRSNMLRAASTGSMPTALGSSLDKMLSVMYAAATPSWKSFAAVKSAASFRQQSSVRPSFPSDLQKIGPNAEIPHSTFEEEVYTWQVGTYARQLKIDRQHFINDSLGAFTEILPSFAKSASRTLTGLVISTMLGNSGNFWHADNSNFISGSDTALSAASLAAAIKKLRQQKDAENNLLDLEPRVLLVSPENEQVAKSLVVSSTMQRYVASTVDQVPMGNPLENVAQVVVEPRLSDSSFTGYSTTAWWLFSAPTNEAVVVGFLDGMVRPTLETFGLNSDINSLSFGFRVFWDFGASLGDHRAAVKSKGSA